MAQKGKNKRIKLDELEYVIKQLLYLTSNGLTALEISRILTFINIPVSETRIKKILIQLQSIDYVDYTESDKSRHLYVLTNEGMNDFDKHRNIPKNHVSKELKYIHSTIFNIVDEDE